MNGAADVTGQGGGAGKGQPWPSPAELVGVWAEAMTQVWDIASSWCKTVAELGFAEQEELQSWSMTVFLPQGVQARSLEWSGLATEQGEVVPASSVKITPEDVSAGTALEELLVVVERPLTQTDHHYLLTIWDRNDPTFRRVYGCAFGVPESET